MFPDLPTLTREFQRLISTGALPPDALDGLVPDASDGDTELAKLAADDEERMYLATARALIGREASKLRMLGDCASDDDMDRQDLAAAKALIDEEADKARRRRMSVDYASDDDEEDCQSDADDEPAVGNPADLYAMYAAYEEEDDEEAGKDYGPHYRLHPDYQSYPANEPEPEDDDVGELEPDFLGPRVPSPRRSPAPKDMDERAGPSATTNHVHYDDDADDVIVIKAGQYDQFSSSSSGSGSPSLTNSDRSSSPERFDDLDEQLARAEERRQQRLAKAMEKPCSPTPDADGIPHFASEDIDMNAVYTLGLQFKSDDEILAGFFGEGHGAVLSNIHPAPPPPPPPTSQNAPPAPPAPTPTERMAIRPELARRLEEVTRPRNVLKRTMNGDAYITDGAGGFMSARTGRHVDQAFAGDFLQRQEANTLRNLAERINAGQVVVTIVQDQTAPASPDSDDDADSVDEQLDGSVSDDADSVEEQLAASTSNEEVSSSQEQQTVDVPTPPTRKRAREESVETEVNDGENCSLSDEEVAQQVLDAPTAPTRKRSREESNDEDEASSEKRRRVRSEEQPGSRAVLRLRSRAPSPSPALGSSTAATQRTLQTYTAAAAAPRADGPAVVEPTQCAANGSDETPTASTSAQPAAEQAQEPAPSANVPARRSTRIREVARVKAAEEARRAAEAAPSPKRRGNGKGKGKGKGKGGA